MNPDKAIRLLNEKQKSIYYNLDINSIQNLAKPLRKPKEISLNDSLKAYLPEISFGAACIAKYNAKIKRPVFNKVVAIYSAYAIIKYGWRPAIRLISGL